MRIELEEDDSGAVVLAVLDGRADVGIFADRTPTLGLHTMRYRGDRLVLVVPAAHPLARRRSLRFAEAAELDFVCLSQGTSLAQRLQAETAALGRALRIRIQVRSFDAMCRMVAAGLGVAVLPERGDPPPAARPAAAPDPARRRMGQPPPADRPARPGGRAAPCAPADRPPVQRA